MPFSDILNPPRAVPGVGVDCASRSGCAGSDSGQGGSGPPDGAERHRGATATLPCQSSNNSTESASRLTPYQRKNAFSINENLNFAVERFGLEKIGFLTLTFPSKLTLKEANRRFNSLASHFLDLHFEAWVCVREFTKSGRPHFHLVVVCKTDIRTGFNWGNYLEMAWMSGTDRRRRKFRAEIKKLSRSLDPSPELRSIWKELHRVLPLYQFGRHELIPIRKNGAALARYVGGYIRKSMDFRPVEAKGARLISYSKSFPRKVVGHAWAFHCEGSELWRQKVSVFAQLHRVKDLDQMKLRFGPRWAWWFRDVIQSLNLLPFLPADRVRGYIESVDSDRFNDALAACSSDESVDLTSLHLYRPKLPEVEGVSCMVPPRRLRSVFEFHLGSWGMNRDEIAARSASDRRRMAALHDSGGTNFTREMIDSARASLLAAPPVRVPSPAAVRSRNFMRMVHPRVYETSNCL